jgi:hypothetical protein
LRIAAAGDNTFGWGVIEADTGAAFSDRSLEAFSGISPESGFGGLDGADRGSCEEEGHDGSFGLEHGLVPNFY